MDFFNFQFPRPIELSVICFKSNIICKKYLESGFKSIRERDTLNNNNDKNTKTKLTKINDSIKRQRY